jgi:outer membrane murein-binding lipoprotein Lpp
MSHSNRVLILAVFAAGLLLWGCSRTLQEKKSTDSDPGNVTQLKFTGSKVKLEHDF